jgi:hypothetical protein
LCGDARRGKYPWSNYVKCLVYSAEARLRRPDQWEENYEKNARNQAKNTQIQERAKREKPRKILAPKHTSISKRISKKFLEIFLEMHPCLCGCGCRVSGTTTYFSADIIT